jgi:uncharacterized protein YbjT (DUF2867 family)
MTIAVIGATGRVGSLVVRGLLDAGEPVSALVRDPGKASEMFGALPGLEIHEVALGRPDAVAARLADVSAAFVAIGSVGIEGALQRVAIQAAGAAGVDQLVRLSVLNTSADSLGINQRAHWSIDFAAEAAGIPYTTVRPAIFSASLLVGAAEVRASRTWTGLADSGRVALVDHRDVADAVVRILSDPTAWGTHYDLTGPAQLSWPEAMALLSAELGETVTFQATTERALIDRLVGMGAAPGQAELLVAREWAILGGENERTTTQLKPLIGREPRTVEAFLHEYRERFS